MDKKLDSPVKIFVFSFLFSPKTALQKYATAIDTSAQQRSKAVFVLFISNRGGPPLHKGFLPLLFPLFLLSLLSPPPLSLNCHLCMSPHFKSVYLEGRVGTRWGTGHPLTDSCTCGQTGSGEAHALGLGREHFKLFLPLMACLLFAQGSRALMTWVLLGSLRGCTATSGVP